MRGGWLGGVVGARGRSAAAVARPLWAVGGPHGVLSAMRENRSRVHDVFARSAHAMGFSMRALASTNFLLHVGMLVACVRVRNLFTFAPPIESCQQLAGDARKLCYAVHEVAPTGPHECCASAATVPKQLF